MIPDSRPLNELVKDAPEKIRDRLMAVIALTDAFCDHHLTAEFKPMCRKLAILLGKEGFGINGGKAINWAAAIVHAVGSVNFLDDPTQTPHMTSAEIAKQLGVVVSTMMDKSRLIREGLGLGPFHPEWTLRGKLADNPLVWMVKLTNGVIIDIRHAPRELQEQALEAGLIPFLPEAAKQG